MTNSFAAPQTGACQDPLSMEFPREEHKTELPFPSPGEGKRSSQPRIRPASPALNKEDVLIYMGSPGGTSGKEPACQWRRHKRCRFKPWVRKIPWRRAWQPTLVILSGESHGQRSLEDCGPQGRRVRHDRSKLARTPETLSNAQIYPMMQGACVLMCNTRKSVRRVIFLLTLCSHWIASYFIPSVFPLMLVQCHTTLHVSWPAVWRPNRMGVGIGVLTPI